MATIWGGDDQKTDYSQFHGSEWNHLQRCAATQTQGALRALGAGVHEGWAVTPGSGLAVDIAPGHGISYSVARGYVWLASKLNYTLGGLEDDSVTYIFAALEIAVVNDALDSRESGVVRWVAQESSALAGAIPIAAVTTADGAVTEIEDLRVFKGAPQLLDDLIEAGRIVGIDTTAGAPIVDAGELLLPQGGKFYIGGRRFALSDDLAMDNVPLNKTGGVYGFLSIDPATDLPTVAPEHWFEAFPTGGALAALEARGWPCLGNVATDAAQVTAVDATVATGHADLLYTQDGLLALIVSSGSGGGGGDEPSIPLVTREEFLTLVARVTELENADGGTAEVAIQTDNEGDLKQSQVLRALVSKYAPVASRYFDDSLPSPRYTGMAQTDGDGVALPDVRGGGTAVLDVGEDEIR